MFQDRIPDPEPIDPDAPRYAPARPLPRHRYLPGFTPRPGERLEEAPEGPVAATELYRHGIDLFNRAYYWEAHEAWELLWQRTPPSPLRDGLQGLIQLAAALLKEHLGVPSGARRLARSGLEKLQRAHDRDAPLLLDLADVVARARAHFARLDDPDAPPAQAPGLRLRG